MRVLFGALGMVFVGIPALMAALFMVAFVVGLFSFLVWTVWSLL